MEKVDHHEMKMIKYANDYVKKTARSGVPGNVQAWNCLSGNQ